MARNSLFRWLRWRLMWVIRVALIGKRSVKEASVESGSKGSAARTSPILWSKFALMPWRAKKLGLVGALVEGGKVLSWISGRERDRSWFGCGSGIGSRPAGCLVRAIWRSVSCSSWLSKRRSRVISVISSADKGNRSLKVRTVKSGLYGSLERSSLILCIKASLLSTSSWRPGGGGVFLLVTGTGLVNCWSGLKYVSYCWRYLRRLASKRKGM